MRPRIVGAETAKPILLGNDNVGPDPPVHPWLPGHQQNLFERDVRLGAGRRRRRQGGSDSGGRDKGPHLTACHDNGLESFEMLRHG